MLEEESHPRPGSINFRPYPPEFVTEGRLLGQRIRSDPQLHRAFALFGTLRDAQYRQQVCYETLRETRKRKEQVSNPDEKALFNTMIALWEEDLKEDSLERKRVESQVANVLRENPDLVQPYKELRRDYEEIAKIARASEYGRELQELNCDFLIDRALMNLRYPH